MVWCHGDPTVEAFAVLANGSWRDDQPPVAVYDLATVGSEHPAPWRWDVARLLASLIAARPDLRDDTTAIVARWCAVYREVAGRAAHGDLDLAATVWLQDLPKPLLTLIERAGEQRRRDQFLNRELATSARLRRGSRRSDDPAVLAWMAPAFAQAVGKRATIVDLVRLSGTRDAGRWLALARDRDRRPRLIDIAAIIPSTLAASPTAGFPSAPAPTHQGALELSRGRDPVACVLAGADRTYRCRTRCHAGWTVRLRGLGEADLHALERLWATLLVSFHLRGAAACGVAIEPLATRLAADADVAAPAIAAIVRTWTKTARRR